MTAVLWTAQNVSLLSRYGVIPILLKDEQWQDWARVVVVIPAIAVYSPPSPDEFPKWEAWAVEFNKAIRHLAQ